MGCMIRVGFGEGVLCLEWSGVDWNAEMRCAVYPTRLDIFLVSGERSMRISIMKFDTYW